MGATKLIRKELKNRVVSKKRTTAIKRITKTPVLKNVDIEKIKQEFEQNKAKAVAKKEAPAKESPKVTTPAPEVEVTPVVTEAPKEVVVEAKKKEAEIPTQEKTLKAEVKKATPKAKKEISGDAE